MESVQRTGVLWASLQGCSGHGRAEARPTWLASRGCQDHSAALRAFSARRAAASASRRAAAHSRSPVSTPADCATARAVSSGAGPPGVRRTVTK